MYNFAQVKVLNQDRIPESEPEGNVGIHAMLILML